MAGILILGETNDGRLDPITGELLSVGSGLGEGIGVALLGDALGGPSEEAIALGADTVYRAEHPLLASGSADAWVLALEQVCRQVEPSVVLLGKTFLGKDVGPRVAQRLGVGVAQDCIGVRIDDTTGRIVGARPVYGGSAIANVTLAGEPQVVIVRPRAFESTKPDSTRSGDILDIEVGIDESHVKVRHIETVQREAEGVRLTDASVVVSGGRGLGGPEPFEQLAELARELGGAVGASRAACDAGWVDHSLQVGLTGASIAPELYLTFGISGASQHMAGCSGAKHIVAVNSDPNANIFKEASFGVVGNWAEVLPAFIEALRELRQN